MKLPSNYYDPPEDPREAMFDRAADIAYEALTEIRAKYEKQIEKCMADLSLNFMEQFGFSSIEADDLVNDVWEGLN